MCRENRAVDSFGYPSEVYTTFEWCSMPFAFAQQLPIYFSALCICIAFKCATLFNVNRYHTQRLFCIFVVPGIIEYSKKMLLSPLKLQKDIETYHFAITVKVDLEFSANGLNNTFILRRSIILYSYRYCCAVFIF